MAVLGVTIIRRAWELAGQLFSLKDVLMNRKEVLVRKRGLLITVGFLLALSPVGMSVQSASAASAVKPAKLEGMSYPKARRVVLSYGWKPLLGECIGGGTSDDICKRYPEIGNCSGTGLGFCDLYFINKNNKKRCLTLITVGGPPGADSVVQDVIFSNAPCQKNK
jgi:hypothetical protein